jgi:copper chaperone CopZ
MIRFENIKNKQNLKIMENLIKHTYHIGGMSCGGCATTVKNKLSAAPGVTSVQVDLAKKEAEITSSAIITADTLQDALKNTHYTIAELRAV